MPDETRLEILLPYVGDPAFFRASVESVLAQQDPRWRLLVVEDGDQGTGASDWLAGLDDPRVRHVVNDRTLGLPANFQRCLDLAEGELVTFLGCDDELAPSYVTVVSEAALAFPDAVAIHPGVSVMDSAGRPIRPVADRVKSLLRPSVDGPRAFAGEPLLTSLLHGNWAYFPSVAWRRRAIEAHGFRSDLSVTMDLALLATLLLDGGSVVLTPETAFRYRRHDESVSSAARRTDRFDEEARLFAELATACRDRGWDSAARAARLHLTSRLHAALLVPGRLRRRQSVRPMVAHLVRR